MVELVGFLTFVVKQFYIVDRLMWEGLDAATVSARIS